MLKTFNKSKQWLDKIEESREWKDAITHSILSTKNFYGNSFMSRSDIERANRMLDSAMKDYAVVFNMDTTQESLFRLADTNDKICILNFASFFNPGGGFLNGAKAQEESLCAWSGLYNVLKENPIYTDRRARSHVSSLYESEIIYNKDVPFTRKQGSTDDILLADVITCAAPNLNKKKPIDKDKFEKSYLHALDMRTKAILMYPALMGAKTLILGAWGCGVFKNDPEVVAKAFADACSTFGPLYENIVFSIPDKVVRNKFMRGFVDGKEEER